MALIQQDADREPWTTSMASPVKHGKLHCNFNNAKNKTYEFLKIKFSMFDNVHSLAGSTHLQSGCNLLIMSHLIEIWGKLIAQLSPLIMG